MKRFIKNFDSQKRFLKDFHSQKEEDFDPEEADEDIKITTDDFTEFEDE